MNRSFPLLSRLLSQGDSGQGPIVLDRRRIYILPTRLGVVFALFLLAMLIASINYGLGLGYAFTFLLGGMAFVGILHTYRNLHGIRVSEAGALPAFAGEAAVFRFAFEAAGPRPALALGWRGQPAVLFDLDAPQRIEVPVPATRRGRLKPGRFTLSSVYPLGLFRAWCHLQFEHSALVYPAPATAAPAFTPRSESGAATHETGGEGSEDFAGLRAWQPGDSPRQVAWKLAAKSGRLASKRFSEAAGGTLLLDWDSLAGLDTETRLSRLARGVLDAEAAGLRYGLELPGVAIAPGLGTAHKLQCLEALALFGLPGHD